MSIIAICMCANPTRMAHLGISTRIPRNVPRHVNIQTACVTVRGEQGKLNMKYLKCALVACAVLATSCQASESIKEGDACRQSSECGDLVCVNQGGVEGCQRRPCDTGYTCQESGVCVASEPECTTARPCSGDRVCELGKCVASGTTPPDIVCYKDAACGEGLGCDHNK